MNQHGYLVYGERLSDAYCGCDAYGYKYNGICEKYFEELDDFPSNSESFLSGLIAKKCYEECRKQNIPANIIYCQIAKDNNKKVVTENSGAECHMSFLGFDVAWKEYDFYSSILHDIISERGVLHNLVLSLNQHGLFPEYAQAEKYRKLRNSLKGIYSDGQFEEGEFFIIAIWKYYDSFLEPENISLIHP